MLTVGNLLSRASDTARHDDFGDPGFREGLERLVSAIEREARLNQQGEALVEYQIVDLLARRLEVERWYGLHPEIDDEQIVRPLIGLGLPRTGSTALACLLAEDPATRSIRAWESSSPCPPPETATEHTDPRIEAQKVRNAQMDALSPRFRTMLPISATAPTECQHYMAYDFKSQLFQAMVRIPSYVDWLNNEADIAPTYAYVKRVLKLLQWHCPPKRWRLKNPAHMLFIDALDATFPDACYWMTHRDVSRVLPSVIDLYCELSRPYTDTLDVDWIRGMNLEWTELGLHRVMEFRQAGSDSRFFDIGFMEMQSTPLAVMERLYTFLGEHFSDVARARMKAWIEQSASEREPKQEVDFASLGIDLDAVRIQFQFYNDAFEAR